MGNKRKLPFGYKIECGRCGTMYRRCTWKRNGKAKIVWRCVSRLDYGTKYCHDSPTMEEGALQQAIMAAINTFMGPKADVIRQITDSVLEGSVRLPNTSLTMEDISRRLEELEQQFNDLFDRGETMETGMFQYQKIMEEMAALKEQRQQLSGQIRENQAAQGRLRCFMEVLTKSDHHMTQWDEEMIRQLIHTVKILSADRIRVIFTDGTQIDQEVRS